MYFNIQILHVMKDRHQIFSIPTNKLTIYASYNTLNEMEYDGEDISITAGGPPRAEIPPVTSKK